MSRTFVVPICCSLILLAVSIEARDLAYLSLVDHELQLEYAPSEREIPDDSVAIASYANRINTTGWAFLELSTSSKYDNEKQAYGAGYLEGMLTADIMWMHWVNTMKHLCTDKKIVCLKLAKFLNKNKKWIMSMINSSAGNDPYWYQVKLYMLQLEGLADGYNKAVNDPKKSLSKDYMLAFNLQGDLEDLFDMMGVQKIPGSGHCSALIKILPDKSDIYTSHVTWTGYGTMLRIQKKYTLPFTTLSGSKDTILGHTVSFSSSPGQLQSGDDFYILSSGLVTLETTIGNSNPALWKNVSPTGQVMEFIRVIIANRLAASGEDWTNIFKKYNSGTYNNQWMIVDYKKAKSTLKPGLLWVLEQLPGNIEAQDMTDYLINASYWASYNIAYFPNIFKIGGFEDLVPKYGDWFTHDKNPRAQIFKRDHDKINNMNDMLDLMRYNDFKNDPLSRCNCTPPYSAENAISARNDMNLINGSYPFPALGHRSHGATDVKVTSTAMMRSYQFLAVSGPTYNETHGIPAFQWSKSDFRDTVSHVGHPDVWKFKPITYKWLWN